MRLAIFLIIICIGYIQLSAQSYINTKLFYSPHSERFENDLNRFYSPKLAELPFTQINYDMDSLKLDEYIDSLKGSWEIPGIATLIIKDDNVVFDKNYGFRNLERQLPVEDSTIFLQASISKTIVATAIMQLWEDGLLQLDQDINNYLPFGFQVINPKQPDAVITVKMLMNHTSSLIDNWDVLLPLCTEADSQIPLDSFLLNYFTPGGEYYSHTNFSDNVPGEKHEYSNMGSCLLALIVENLKNTSFDEYTRENIFKPLSMNSTTWFLKNTDTTKLATLYQYGAPWILLGAPYYPIYQLRTNKFDLSKFLKTYLNDGKYNENSILDSATISLMLSDQLGFPNSREVIQGLIWYHGALVSPNSWGHGGSWDGCITNMNFNRVENYEFMFFMNYNNWITHNTFIESIKQMEKLFDDYSMLYGNVYALNCTLSNNYASINSSSTLFCASFVNKYEYNYTPSVICRNSNNEIIDSVEIVDDGNNGDLIAGDGIFSAYLNPVNFEDFFQIDVSTVIHETNKYFKTPDRVRFTSAGPLIVDDYECVVNDSLITIDNLKLLNQGTQREISSVYAKLNPLSDCITGIPNSKSPFGTIQPGSSKTAFTTYGINIKNCPEMIELELEISSNDIVYWKDTLVVDIPTGIEDEPDLPNKFALAQNYPNPFNPSTTIKYSIPVDSKQYAVGSRKNQENETPLLGGAGGGLMPVELVVYDLLGREVASLVNEQQRPGNYEVKWDASGQASGVYFYKLTSGFFSGTKKMVLLR